MTFTINFNEEKNQLLKATRGVCFDDIVKAIKNKQLLDNITNTSSRHPLQKVYVINIKNYAYAVPYVINKTKKEIFLKTIYLSKALTRRYIRKKTIK